MIKRLLAITIIFPLLFYLFVMITYFLGSPTDITLPIQGLFFPGLIFVCVFIFPLIIVVIQFFMFSEKNKGVVLSISEDGFTRAGNGFEFKRTWPEFNNWRETKEFIYLFITPYQGVAHVIQKRMMSVEELTECREIFKKYLN